METKINELSDRALFKRAKNLGLEVTKDMQREEIEALVIEAEKPAGEPEGNEEVNTEEITSDIINDSGDDETPEDLEEEETAEPEAIDPEEESETGEDPGSEKDDDGDDSSENTGDEKEKEGLAKKGYVRLRYNGETEFKKAGTTWSKGKIMDVTEKQAGEILTSFSGRFSKI